jgi:hypothetical protein
VKVINAEGTAVVDLPDNLAKMLLGREWSKCSAKEYNAVLESDVPDFTAAEVDNDEPLPMTRIPGVVDISMNRLKKLVADGTIPHELKDRTKLVKPSDVRTYLLGRGV